MTGAPLRKDFDGEAIPLRKDTIDAAIGNHFEHVLVENWGFALSANKYRYEGWFTDRLLARS